MRVPDGLLGPDTERACVTATRVCSRNAVTDADTHGCADADTNAFADTDTHGCADAVADAEPHCCANTRTHAAQLRAGQGMQQACRRDMLPVDGAW